MAHADTPLTPAGRPHLVERCQYRPVAHVAAEAGVARRRRSGCPGMSPSTRRASSTGPAPRTRVPR